MNEQLVVEIKEVSEGTSVLSVEGPTEAVVMAFSLILSFMADDPQGVADEIESRNDGVGDVRPS